MSPWSFSQYERPYLLAREIRASGTNLVMVRGDAGLGVEISMEGSTGREIARTLRALRDPGARRWRSLAVKDTDPLREVVQQLDRIGMIGDASQRFRAQVQFERERLEEDLRRVRHWVDTVLEKSSDPNGRALVLQIADLAQSMLFRHESVVMPLEWGRELHRAALFHQLAAWRRSSPLALAAVAVLAVDLARPFARNRERWGGLRRKALMTLRERIGGSEGTDGLMAALQAFSFLLLGAAIAPRPRVAKKSLRLRPEMTGTALLLVAERLVRATTQAVCSRASEEILGRRLEQKFAEIILFQQYYVSSRFAGAIAPLLARVTRPPLHKKYADYFKEECGHEEFERNALREAGYGEDAVTQSVALPLFVTYIDLFSYAANHDEFSFLVAILVAEGLPDYVPVVADAVRVALSSGNREVDPSAHEEANVALNHSTLARQLAREIPVVSRKRAAKALEFLELMIEVNQYAWDHAYAAGRCARYRPGADLLCMTAADLNGLLQRGGEC